MIKRLIATTAAALVLVIGVPNVGYTSSQQLESNDGTSGGPANIEAGLCVGASLDLSAASKARCVRQTQSRNATTPQSSDASQSAPTHQHSSNTSGTSSGSTVPLTPTSDTYVALGDSVAAGLGLSDSTDSQPECGRSAAAYPNLVSAGRGLPLNHLACAGATAGDLTTEQHIPGPNPLPQIEQAFSAGTPQLITITAGANDVHWDTFLRKCFSATCGTDHDNRIMTTLLAALNVKLTAAFSEIKQRSGSNPPQVIVTGYFNPLSQSCAQTEPRLTTDEINWISTQLTALNQTIENSTKDLSFVTFAPIDFAGHDVCSSQPWVQSLGDPAPLHPNAAGQTAIAQMIL